jgi:branched-subunit amino acid ABC-type transport system permease component
VDRLILAGIAIVLTMLLWAAMRFTRFRLAITASAENERAVSTLSWSSNLLSAVTWSAGCALAGVEHDRRHLMIFR